MLVHNQYPHSFASLEDAKFDLRAFSQLKYGSDDIARRFAREMAHHLITDTTVADLLATRPCVIVPAPCSTIPVAGSLLAKRLREELNDRLARTGGQVIGWSRIHRDVHYNFDYSSRSLEERRELLTDEGRYVNSDYLGDKVLLFIDDVRITGTHEEKLTNLLSARGMDNDRVFCAYATYTGDNAKIEHELNHVWVAGIESIIDMALTHERVVLTPRAIRMALETQALILRKKLSDAPFWFVEQVYHGAIVKGYHEHEPFKDAFYSIQLVYDALKRSRDTVIPFVPAGSIQLQQGSTVHG